MEVYRNLNRTLDQGAWSVRSCATGRVILYATQVELRDVVCRVSEAQRQRVLREGRRNVHAVLRGVLVAYDHGRGAPRGWTRIHYDPLRAGCFTTGALPRQRRVLGADSAIFDARGRAWVQGAEMDAVPALPFRELAPRLRGMLRRRQRAAQRAAA